MDFWQTFWLVAVLTAGSAFAIITLVVTIKGAQDMKNMLSGLKAHQDDDKTH
jgi:hypothetical protein